MKRYPNLYQFICWSLTMLFCLFSITVVLEHVNLNSSWKPLKPGAWTILHGLSFLALITAGLALNRRGKAKRREKLRLTGACLILAGGLGLIVCTYIGIDMMYEAFIFYPILFSAVWISWTIKRFMMYPAIKKKWLCKREKGDSSFICEDSWVKVNWQGKNIFYALLRESREDETAEEADVFRVPDQELKIGDLYSVGNCSEGKILFSKKQLIVKT